MVEIKGMITYTPKETDAPLKSAVLVNLAANEECKSKACIFCQYESFCKALRECNNEAQKIIDEVNRSSMVEEGLY